MPIVDAWRKCVLFLGTKRDGVFQPVATAFVVGIDDGDLHVRNLVTAEHVIRRMRDTGLLLWMRFNTKDGGTAEEHIPLSVWRSHPDNANEPTDVSTTIFNPRENADILPIPLIGEDAQNATLETFAQAAIGIGDEVVMIGLFRNHYGAQRNQPVVRVGALSAISDEPVHTRYCGPTQAHLIEARSIGGLSGSPVILRSQPVRMNRDGKAGYNTAKPEYLLGLMHGHFDVQSLNEDVVVDDEAGGGSINVGMGVVIPVEKIIETVDQPFFRDLRKKAIEDHNAAQKLLGSAQADQEG